MEIKLDQKSLQICPTYLFITDGVYEQKTRG